MQQQQQQQEQEKAQDQDGYEQRQAQYEPNDIRQANAPGPHHQPGFMLQHVPQQQSYPQPQYPGQAQQYPMQTIIQTGPNNGGACGGPYEKYKANKSFALGLIQIFIGILCIIFNIIGIILLKTSYGYYSQDFTFFVDYGMWPSFFFIIAGGFGIRARSKIPCPVITFMVMSILAAVFTTIVIGFSSIGIGIESYGESSSMKTAKLAMHCLLLILGVVELVVAIWSSCICCAAACCGHNNNGNVHATPVVQYRGQAGQQQVFMNTQGQQQTFNSQPQPGGSSYPAAGSGPPQPSASTPGMPPAYSAASAPPVYGGPPLEEKSGMPHSN